MSNRRLFHSCRSEECRDRHGGGKHRGPDSFWMHDSNILFNRLKLKDGDVFADLGCGIGKYALSAARIVGEKGCVYAVDRLSGCINTLNEEADTEGLPQLKAINADIIQEIPIRDESCDSCFVSTVLHSIDLTEHADHLFEEIY